MKKALVLLIGILFWGSFFGLKAQSLTVKIPSYISNDTAYFPVIIENNTGRNWSLANTSLSFHTSPSVVNFSELDIVDEGKWNTTDYPTFYSGLAFGKNEADSSVGVSLSAKATAVGTPPVSSQVINGTQDTIAVFAAPINKCSGVLNTTFQLSDISQLLEWDASAPSSGYDLLVNETVLTSTSSGIDLTKPIDIVGDSLVCKDQLFDLYASSVGDSIFVSSSNPSFVDLAVENSVTTTLPVNSVGAYYFQFKNNQCSVYDTVVVQLSDIQAQATITSGLVKPDSSCFQDTLLIDGSSSSSSFGLTYNWVPSNSGDYIEDASASVLKTVPSVSGDNQFILEATDMVGCIDRDTVDFYHNDEVTLLIQDIYDTVILCVTPTTNEDFEADVSGGLPFPGVDPYLYQWTVEDPTKVILGAGSENDRETILITDDTSGTTFLYLEVEDILGCTQRDSVYLILEQFHVEIDVQYDPICVGLNDTLTVSVNGGSNQYSYGWFGPKVVSKFDNKGILFSNEPGNFEADVLVSDNNEDSGFEGCASREKVFIEVREINPVITDTMDNLYSKHYVCFEDTLFLTGGNSSGLYGDLSYTWRSIIDQGETFVGVADSLNEMAVLVGGAEGSTSTTRLIIRDSIGCLDTTTTQVFWNSEIIVEADIDTALVCNSASRVINVASTVGGVPNYSYQWEILNTTETAATISGSTTQSSVEIQFSNTQPYDTAYVLLTAFDSLGCADVDSVVLVNTQLRTEINIRDSILCTNLTNDLEVNVLIPGNEYGPYQYTWHEMPGQSFVSNSVSINPSKPVNGNYTFRAITEDQTTGCSDTATVTYEVKKLLAAAIAANRPSQPYIVCYTDSIVLDASNTVGGTVISSGEKYKYQWTDLNGAGTNFSPEDTTETVTLTYLPTTVDTVLYELAVEDRNGCQDTTDVSVIWDTPITVSVLEDTVFSCVPTEVALEVDNTTGGAPNYSYTWSPSNLINNANTDSASILLPLGDTLQVFVEAKDALGCTATDSLSAIGIRFGIDLIADFDSICQGVEDTLFSVLKDSKVGPFNYTWSPSANVVNDLDSAVVIGQAQSEWYKVSVQDQYTGCVAEDSVQIDQYLLNAKISVIDGLTACFDEGEKELNASASTGGSPISGTVDYNYTWGSDVAGLDFSATNTEVISVDTGTVNRGITTPVFLEIEDKIGCIGRDTVDLFWNKRLQTNLSLVNKDTTFICIPGNVTINITVNGGTAFTNGDYQYEWEPSSIITDNTVLSPEVTLNTKGVEELVLTVTDSLGCVHKDTSYVSGLKPEVNIQSALTTICAEVADTLEVIPLQDFIGTMSVQWSGAGVFSDPNDAETDVQASADSKIYVEVTDDQTLCVAKDSIELDVYNLAASISPLKGITACFEASDLEFEVTPSVENNNTAIAPTYAFNWSSPEAVSIATPNLETTTVAIGAVTPGTSHFVYVSIQDEIGCSTKDSIEVLWNTEIDISLDDSLFICAPAASNISAIVTGGTPKNPNQYQYNWLSTYISNTTSEMPEVTVPGSVSEDVVLTITDSVGCMAKDTALILGIVPEVDIQALYGSVCAGGSDTLSAVLVNDFYSSNLTYLWASAEPLSASSASKTGVDVNGSTTVNLKVTDNKTRCFAEDAITVSTYVLTVGIDLIKSNTQSTATTLCFDENVQLQADVNIAPSLVASYEWIKTGSGVQSTNSVVVPSFDAAEVGLTNSIDYKLIVTGTTGCKDSSSITLSKNNQLFAFAHNPGEDNRALCQFDTITVGHDTQLASGGTGSYNINWSVSPSFGTDLNTSNQQKPVFTATSSGSKTITLEVSDQQLTYCKAFDYISVEVIALPEASFSKGFSELNFCEGTDTILVAGDYTSSVTPKIQWYYNAANLPVEIDSIKSVNGGTADTLTTPLPGYYTLFVENTTYGCVNYDTAKVVYDSLPSVSIIANDSLCNNVAIELLADYYPKGNASSVFQWLVPSYAEGIYDNTQRNDTIFNYNSDRKDDSVRFHLVHTNQCGTDTANQLIVFTEAPLVQFTASSENINPENEVTFTNTTNVANASYVWNIETSATEELQFTQEQIQPILYNAEGVFEAQLIASDPINFCKDSASIHITVELSRVLFVPNVFSPEANNPENRVVKVYGESLIEEDFYFAIYNRWGDLIYETDNLSQAQNIGWTGENANTNQQDDLGVYTYTLRCKFIDKQQVNKEGTITLLK